MKRKIFITILLVCITLSTTTLFSQFKNTRGYVAGIITIRTDSAGGFIYSPAVGYTVKIYLVPIQNIQGVTLPDELVATKYTDINGTYAYYVLPSDYPTSIFSHVYIEVMGPVGYGKSPNYIYTYDNIPIDLIISSGT